VPLCTKKARPALFASSVLLLPVTVTLAVIIGSDRLSVTVPTPLLIVMVLVPPAALESKMAWRSEPAPLSPPLLTKKSAAQAEPASTGQSVRQVADRSVAAKRPAIAEQSAPRILSLRATISGGQLRASSAVLRLKVNLGDEGLRQAMPDAIRPRSTTLLSPNRRISLFKDRQSVRDSQHAAVVSPKATPARRLGTIRRRRPAPKPPTL